MEKKPPYSIMEIAPWTLSIIQPAPKLDDESLTERYKQGRGDDYVTIKKMGCQERIAEIMLILSSCASRQLTTNDVAHRKRCAAL
ncbi:MAG: hypothetical protein QNK37_25320 [Acidobacteriota bacterium]|nr:hypothetical protein [Acidobacteriota bacterium]